MKKLRKDLKKKICSFAVALAMVLSVSCSPVLTVSASQAEELNTVATGTDAATVDAEIDEAGEITETTEAATPEATATVVFNTQAPLNGEGTEISQVEITLDLPLVGSDDYTVSCQAPEGANYEVTASCDWRAAGGSSLYEGYEFEYETGYWAHLVVTPKSGYTIAADATYTVNGEAVSGSLEDGFGYVDVLEKSYFTGVVDSVDLSNIPESNIGDSLAEYLEEGEGYIAKGYWYVYDYENKCYSYADASGVIENGGSFKLCIDINAKEGYIFGEGVTLSGNVDIGNYYFDKQYGYAEIVVDHAILIDEIVISKDSIPEAVVGESFTAESKEIAVPAGSNYTATYYWLDENGNTTGTFEKGKDYTLFIDIYANKGYAFAENVQGDIGGESVGFHGGGTQLTNPLRVSLKTPIDKIVIDKLPEAIVGEEIHKGTDGGAFFEIQAPEGANYSILGAWSITDTGETPEGTFQDRESYTLYIYVEPNDGYEFVDSIPMEIEGVVYANSGSGYDRATLYMTYSSRQVIDTIEINGVKEPALGEAATVDTLKVPEGANYTIISATWTDVYTGEAATTFQDGREYYLDVELEPKDGYEFAIYSDFFVDGEDFSDMGWVGPGVAYVTACEVSFEEIIPELRVNNMPEMKVGDKASVEGISVPEDADYEIVYATWRVWDDTLKNYFDFEGVFEAGKSYNLYIDVCPKEGYRFDKKTTVVYINGTVDTSVIAYSDGATISKEYSVGLKVIDRVEVTVSEPVMGAHSSMSPQFTVSDGAGYAVHTEGYNPDWLMKKGDNGVNYYGYFEEGKDYGVSFVVYSEDGYVFAEDVVVVVNGKVITSENMGIGDKLIFAEYFFDAECSHIYGDWSDAKDGTHARECTVCGYKEAEKHKYTDGADTTCDVCGATKTPETSSGSGGTAGSTTDGTGSTSGDAGSVAGSPATGDNSQMIIACMLMIMCGMGILALDKRKKRSNQ